jgi:hypothetical protein
MDTTPYVVIPISCSHCQAKQVVQVHARTGFIQTAEQTVRCLKCEKDFRASLPNQIIGGPFPPASADELEEAFARARHAEEEKHPNKLDYSMYVDDHS